MYYKNLLERCGGQITINRICGAVSRKMSAEGFEIDKDTLKADIRNANCGYEEQKAIADYLGEDMSHLFEKFKDEKLSISSFASAEEFANYIKENANEEKRLENLIENLRNELSETKKKRNIKLENCLVTLPYTSVLCYQPSFEVTSKVWLTFRDLTKRLFIKRFDTSGRVAYTDLDRLPPEEKYLVCNFLNEIIPIWNKYFLEANAEYLDKGPERTNDKLQEAIEKLCGEE